jgi:hypothetical protein
MVGFREVMVDAISLADVIKRLRPANLVDIGFLQTTSW